MLKLKSGRVIFFEAISSVWEEPLGTLVIELSTKEELEFSNLTMEQFIERRNNYFAEMSVRGQVTEEFGTKVVAKLKTELETAITTLQTATIAYDTSAKLANVASKTLADTSEKVTAKATNVFEDVVTSTTKSATKFGNDIDTIYLHKVKPTIDKLQEQVGKLEAELAYIQE